MSGKESDLARYDEFYDDETRDFVANLYQADIQNFNYTFEDAL